MLSSAQLERPSLGFVGHQGRVCPHCIGTLETATGSYFCVRCETNFPSLDGIADLRIASDRYLDLASERTKARRLASIAATTNLTGLSSAYYAMTDDVDDRRRKRFLAHIRAAEERGEILADTLRASDRVLEIGCGTGGLLLAALRRGIDIEGVDIASRWLVLARKRLQEGAGVAHVGSRNSNEVLTAANAEALPWPDESFDCVVADSVIEHLANPCAVFAEWLRVVKPGGRLILWSPNRFSLATDPHVGLWAVGWLPRQFQASLVRARRRCPWPIQLRTAIESARLARHAGWTVRRAEPSPAPSRSVACHHLYERARKLPLARNLLLRFGPLWQIIAEREVTA